MNVLKSRGCLLSIAAALILLVLFGEIPSGARWAVVLSNSAHGPVFAVLAVIIIVLKRDVQSGSSVWRDCAISFVAAVLLGVLIEILQLFVARDAEVQDVVTDALGAITGLGLFAFFDGSHRAEKAAGLRRIALLSALLAFAAVEAPVAETAAAYGVKYRRFPVLMDASAPLGTYFLAIYDGITADKKPLPVELSANRSIGLHLRPGSHFPWAVGLYETKQDWSDKKYLAIQLANPTDTPVHLGVRIDNASYPEDRRYSVNANVAVAPHSNETQRVPLADLENSAGHHRIDLSAVGAIILYGRVYEDAPECYLLKMWLE